MLEQICLIRRLSWVLAFGVDYHHHHHYKVEKTGFHFSLKFSKFFDV